MGLLPRGNSWTVPLVVDGGAAGLDSLDLGEVDGLAAEAGGELAAVEEDAARGGDGAEVGARGAAHAHLADGLLEGAELLGVVAVGGEGGVLGALGGPAGAEALGEGAGGGLRVGAGSVVDVGWGVG